MVLSGRVLTVSGPMRLSTYSGVGVARVLGRRRRPQRALYPSALVGQPVPPCAGVGLAEELVGELGLCDRRFARGARAPRRCRSSRVGGRPRCRLGSRRTRPRCGPRRGRRRVAPRLPGLTGRPRGPGVAAKEKIRVTLMLRPSAIIASMAGTPALVAGILTSRFGAPMRACRSRAAVMVASVSSARSGATSIETNPSAPSLSSKVGRSRSSASMTSADDEVPVGVLDGVPGGEQVVELLVVRRRRTRWLARRSWGWRSPPARRGRPGPPWCRHAAMARVRLSSQGLWPCSS